MKKTTKIILSSIVIVAVIAITYATHDNKIRLAEHEYNSCMNVTGGASTTICEKAKEKILNR